MKNIISTFLRTFLVISLGLVSTFSKIQAQNTHYIIDEFQKKDSVSDEKYIKPYLDSLLEKGYYTVKIDSFQNERHTYYIYKGKKYETPIILLDSLAQTLIKTDELNSTNLVGLLKSRLEENGYAFAEVNSQFQNDTLYIKVQPNAVRKINGLVFKTEMKLPKGFQKEMTQDFQNQLFNEQSLTRINEQLNQNPFVESQKPAQVLFLKDSTFIYLYPKRLKKSYFDGIIGFTNTDTGKFKITGNVDLQLGNAFNAFEELQLHWNSAANSSQEFRLRMNFPYIAKTPLGTETNMHIFRQDSTFVNFNFKENLFYRINSRTRIGVQGYIQSSTYLENSNTSPSIDYQDFSKTALGFTYTFWLPNSIRLFEQKLKVDLEGDFINARKDNSSKSSQYHIVADFRYLYALNAKNYLYGKVRYENLLSDDYVNNELFRLGGIYSLRGFNENSILANSYFQSTLEYRFLPNEAFYFSVFTDAGQFENRLQDQSNLLFGFGTGITFQTKFGLFSLQYALGKFPKMPIGFDDSRIHIGIKALF